MNKKNGFTLIEILIVVAIISILVTVILVSFNGSRKNARINSAKSTLKSAVTAVVMCTITEPAANQPSSDTGGGFICGGSGPTWPVLIGDYKYDLLSGDFTSSNCNFHVTSGDVPNPPGYLTCDCITQLCQ